SHHHGLAFAHWKIGDNAVERHFVGGFLEHVGNPSQVGAILRDVLVRRIFLRFRLGHARLGLRKSRLGRLPCRLLHVVILLGNKGGVVQTLGAVPVKLGVGGVGFARLRSASEVLRLASAATASVSAACTDARVAFTSANDCTFSSCASN